MLRLRPMDDAGFRAFLERIIPGRAERWTARGLWLADQALETSRKEYDVLFPQGRQTPHQLFFDVQESGSGTVVGEAWCVAREAGGKVEFWIQWVSIWPEYRRRGYGSELLARLEEEARRLGAERTILTVWQDNPGAFALYTKLGYVTSSQTMMKDVGQAGATSPAPSPE